MEEDDLSADDVIITDRLSERPARDPDHAAENRALEALANELVERPQNVLQKLADTIVELGIGESAGVSIEEVAEVRQFRWVALAGVWSQLRGSTIPFDASPCGLAVTRDQLLLIESPERFFAEAQVEPLIHEGLLVPFRSDGKPVGTLWINSHNPDRKFDQEDARLLQALARFAEAGYRMTQAIQTAEAGRLDSDSRFRALATVGSSSVYRMSPDWREMCHLDGAAFLPDTREPTADWIETYIPVDERMRVRDAIRQAVATKGVFELEHQVVRADGSIGWTFSRAMPILDSRGEITEWFGAATDVTDRVRANRSFTRLFQASPAPFLVLKPDSPRFTIVEVNDAYLTATMRTRDDVVGRGVFEAYPANPSDEIGESVEALRASLDRVLASRQPDTLPNLQYDVARPDGTFEQRWWSPVNSAVLDDDGNVEALIHNANDVTEDLVAAAALRESESRLAAAFESVPAGIAVLDLKAMVVIGNAQYRRFLPNNIIPSRDPERGWRWQAWDEHGQAINPQDFPSARALRGETVVPGQEMLHTQDSGREVWTQVATIPVRDADERITGVACVISDIDALKRGEAALRESEERQAFLLKLSDALRPLADALEIQTKASRLVGEHLGVRRAGYGEVEGGDIVVRADYADGVPSMIGRYPIAAFGQAIADIYRDGGTAILRDAATDPGLNDADRRQLASAAVAAHITVSLRKSGRPAITFGVHSDEPRDWTSAEIMLVEEVAERTWAAVERARAEAALQESEEKFRTVFETIDHAFVIQEIIRDDAGLAIDMRYVEINSAFTRQTGLGPDIVGKLVSEVLPDVDRFFIDIHDRVARTGASERFENFDQSTGRWYDAHITAVGGQGRLAVSVFEDISTRKLAEIALRESEERQAFLLQLSDAIRPLTDPFNIQTTAMRLLAERLNVMRASYFEIEADDDTFRLAGRYERDATPMPERMRLSDFSPALGEAYRSGRTLTVDDTSVEGELVAEPAAYAAIGVKAWAAVPLMRNGRLVAWIGVHSRTKRDWSAADVQVLDDAAERTWGATERARAEAALRESEERLRQFGEASQDVLWIRDAKTLQWTYLTPAFDDIYGLTREEALGGENYGNWLDLIVPEDREHAKANIDRVRAGEHVTFEFRIRRPRDGTVRWMRNTDFPIYGEDGRVALIGGIGHDATDLKRSIERQATLLAELQHRVRNILAVTRSIISRSDDGERSTEDYVQHLQGRIAALARTQVLLTRAAGTAIDLDSLIRDELLAQVASFDRITLNGADVTLSPKVAEVLTLALHELATNATKYGAFSHASGQLNISWRVDVRDGQAWLMLDWKERGVSIVDAAPRRRGFGAELISRRIPYELKGHGTFELKPGGIESHIEFPLSSGESILQTDAGNR